MTKSDFSKILERMALNEPSYLDQLGEIAKMLTKAEGKEVPENLILRYMAAHPDFSQCLRSYLDSPEQLRGQVFQVHSPYSAEIRNRLELAKVDKNYQNWANTLRSLPEFTETIREVDSQFLQRAKEVWSQNIYGNEEILQTLLLHSFTYGKTGRTLPILLVGSPGAGKTLVAKNYGRILNLPTSFHSGPSASMGRGLSGSPNLYAGAGAGLIVQSMIDHGIGNPVICIDEIEKTNQGYSGATSMQDQLLSLLDDSTTTWRDNFLEVDVDASHIPFIFTANEIERVTPPLLDRMEVIHMAPPTLPMLHNITRDFTLPRALKKYSTDQVEFPENELTKLVDMLWDSGNHSCRAYQKAIELLVSSACLNALELNHPVHITEKEVCKIVEKCSPQSRPRSIGFNV